MFRLAPNSTFRRSWFLPVITFLLLSVSSYCQAGAKDLSDTSKVWEYTTQGRMWMELLGHDLEWYKSSEAQVIAGRILEFQNRDGGWPKNIDFTEDVKDSEHDRSTIDNGATYTQLFFIGNINSARPEARYREAFLKGLDYLLEAQYANGGWPQYYPLRRGYSTHITFNDDAMVGVLRLLADIDRNAVKYPFIGEERRQQASSALKKGINCILATQYRRNGELTAWCAQHHEKTLQPAGARKYELTSLSGKETVGILLFLMDLDNPGPEIISAVNAGIAWLENVKLSGIRMERQARPRTPKGYDKVVIKDPDAPFIWARFYKLEDDRPFFSDRDGGTYWDLADISYERRNQYGWLGYWPQEALDAYNNYWADRWLPTGNK